MLTTVTRSLVLPSVDMLTSSCSVSPEMTSVPPVVMSASSRSVSSKKVSHPMLVQVFERHEDWVRCVRFYPDNGNSGGVAWSQWLVDASRDGKMVVSDKTVRIWNRESGIGNRESGETMHSNIDLQYYYPLRSALQTVTVHPRVFQRSSWGILLGSGVLPSTLSPSTDAALYWW
jgi:WD40 repeat protein